MSDDKDPKNPPKGDGTGPESDSKTTTMGFGELFGHIDSRIEDILSKRGGGSKDSDSSSAGTGSNTGDAQSVRDQLRAELAKLQGEEAAKQKEADRDVTIAELKEQVAKINEGAPVQEVSRLTQIMWGKKKTS